MKDTYAVRACHPGESRNFLDSSGPCSVEQVLLFGEGLDGCLQFLRVTLVGVQCLAEEGINVYRCWGRWGWGLGGSAGNGYGGHQ